MSTKTASKKPAAAPEAAAPKTPRKARVAPMSAAQKFEVMSIVKGASADVPDVWLAAVASEAIGRAVNPQTIAEYRKAFGLPSVRMPTANELRARVEALEAENRALTEAVEPLKLKVADYKARLGIVD